MSYRLTNAANDDLLSILVEGLERFGSERARTYRASLQRRFDMLAKRPRMATTREGLPAHVRVSTIGQHVILYRMDDAGGIVVLRVRHGREDWISEPL